MDPQIKKDLPKFLGVLRLDEVPMGIFYTDERPAEGFSPKPMDMPTREKEAKPHLARPQKENGSLFFSQAVRVSRGCILAGI
jgi:hypothetical protein